MCGEGVSNEAQGRWRIPEIRHAGMQGPGMTIITCFTAFAKHLSASFRYMVQSIQWCKDPRESATECEILFRLEPSTALVKYASRLASK